MNKELIYWALKGIKFQIILFVIGVLFYISDISLLRPASYCLMILNLIAGIILFIKFYNTAKELQELNETISKLLSDIKIKL